MPELPQLCHPVEEQPATVLPIYKNYFHRDQMTGHNTANVLRGHVQYGERLEYSQPVGNDGNLIWSSKRKAVSRADSDEDVPLPKKRNV
ncbi:hypothetical protein BGW42_004007 [Actinomortierella wolfii]|nr:hypothetical protein BGW42_004007 [Actinomortierella wolfii]